LGLPRFSFPWDGDKCPVCDRKLVLLLTRRRTIISATDSSFIAIERQGYCPQHPDLPPARSRELSQIVAPFANHAYDVLVRVGLARFLRCRQTEEIRGELSRDSQIEVPESTVRYLAPKFLAYLQIVHEQSIPLLSRDMSLRGGYILHIDGSCEGASGVLLVCADSISGQVLESRKIGSENHDEVKQVLKDVRKHWGLPLALVHDLRRPLITAASEVFRTVPQFICHYHLAADVGKDILQPHADRLRRLVRRTKVRANLRALVRSLKNFATSEDTTEYTITSIIGLRSKKNLKEHCTPDAVNAAVHSLASWILAYPKDGDGYDFPFSMPYFNLYERILSVHEALCDASICDLSLSSRGPLASLRRLIKILEPVVSGDEALEFRQIAAAAKRDMRIFDRFRCALRICEKGSKKTTSVTSSNKSSKSLLSSKRHQALLKRFRSSLNAQAQRNGPSARACGIVVDHLDKYWPYLFGHLRQTGSRTIPVPRTNNFLERLFGIIKQQSRRLRGSANLSRDIQDMSPAAPLVLNLGNRSYCDTVFGGTDPALIALRFSSVDPTSVAQRLTTWRRQKLSKTMPSNLAKLKSLPSHLALFLSVAVYEL